MVAVIAVLLAVVGWGIAAQLKGGNDQGADPGRGDVAAQIEAERFLRALAREDLVTACTSVVAPGGVVNPCVDTLQALLPRLNLSGADVSKAITVRSAQMSTTERGDRSAVVTNDDLVPAPSIACHVRLRFIGDRWRVTDLNDQPLRD